MSDVADAVRRVVCPRCAAGEGVRCHVRSGRNHTERVQRALEWALGLVEVDGSPGPNVWARVG